MRITSIQGIYEALILQHDLHLDNQGNLHTDDPTEVGATSGKPAPSTIEKENILLAMGSIVENEKSSQAGPQNLTTPLPARHLTKEEHLQHAQKILTTAIIQSHTQACIQEHPRVAPEKLTHIQNGASEYVMRVWNQKSHADFSFQEIRTVVERVVTDLKEKRLLGILACGFILDRTDLSKHRFHLQVQLRQVVQETMADQHDHFDKNGVYDIFTKDSVRNRPNIFNHQFSHQDYDNSHAEKEYPRILASGLHDPSMVAVVSILMSQTAMVEQAEMLMGKSAQYSLNPYATDTRGDEELITLLTENINNIPQCTVTQNQEEIQVHQHFTIGIVDINTGDKFNIGETSVLIAIPKDQFPLRKGQPPELYVQNMIATRPKNFY